MTFDKKKIALIVIGGVLALSFLVFLVLFAKYDRGGDPNNEDALLKLAHKAMEQDNPPLAAEYWRRLVSLNPFNEEYKKEHFHALIRVRDFKGVMSYTNSLPLETSLTADERRFEELLVDASIHSATGAVEMARACYTEATNLNYFAATPLLIDLEVQNGRLAEALTLARPFLKRFPIPRLLVFAAEWCALAKRDDLIPEIQADCPANTKVSSVAFDYYCEALIAWTTSDTNKLATAKALTTEDYFRTPLSRLMRLESASLGDDPDRVASAYEDLRKMPKLLDFPLRGRLAVKNFIAAHFPNKLPLKQLASLADLVLADGEPDLDLLRVSFMAKLDNNSLNERDLEAAEKRFPNDKGLKLIRKWYAETKSR